MRNCFILTFVITAAADILSGATANNTAAVMFVVRADSRSGRLVRSVSVAPSLRKAAPRIELPAVVEDAPAQLATLVDRIAEQHSVDRDLVDSIIRVESNYNQFAVSSKGALGLMQLVPSTARRFGVADVFNPAQNVDGGVRYLKYLLNLYDGDHRLALAAYNAGEGTVERYGGVPPFPETRDYVYRVGKAFNETKEAKKRADTLAQSTGGLNPISAFVDAMGRFYYKTP